MPGERELRMKTERESAGIPIDAATWRAIVQTAEELGVEPRVG